MNEIDSDLRRNISNRIFIYLFIYFFILLIALPRWVTAIVLTNYSKQLFAKELEGVYGTENERRRDR